MAIFNTVPVANDPKKIKYTGDMMAPGTGVLAPSLPVNSELTQEQVVEQAPDQVQPQVATIVATPVQPVAPQEQPQLAQQIPGVKEELAGLNLQQRAIEEKSAADNKLISELIAKQIADAEEMDAKRVNFEKDQNDKLNAYNKELETLNNTPIKSPDWWGSKTTGEKIMAGVGLFFAALGNKGQMTQALASIDNQIENDIRLQEKNLEAKREGVRGKIGILDKMRSIYGDIESSKLASKKAIYDGLARQLEINANNANSKMAKAAFMQGVAKAKQESARYNDSLLQKQQELELKKAEFQAKQSQGAGLTPAQKIIDEEFAKNYSSIKDKLPETKSKINSLREAITELGKSDSISGPIAGRVGGFLNPKALAMQDRIQGLMVDTVKQLFPGATSDFEVQAAVGRAYNPLLPEKENIKKLLPILEGIEKSYKNRKAELDEFNKKGTLSQMGSSSSPDDLMSIMGASKTTSDRKKELEEKMRIK